MATMVLPIRELSANVQLEAACAQKQVVKAQPRLGVFAWAKVRLVNYYLGKLVNGESDLIARLQSVDLSKFPSDALESLAGDLDRIVSLTDAVVDQANDMPNGFVEIWRPNLDAMEQHARHIDSIAESLHAETDPECMMLLSIAAEQAV